jgi:hypothetical protein
MQNIPSLKFQKLSGEPCDEIFHCINVTATQSRFAENKFERVASDAIQAHRNIRILQDYNQTVNGFSASPICWRVYGMAERDAWIFSFVPGGSCAFCSSF